jgi:hypothetical protein
MRNIGKNVGPALLEGAALFGLSAGEYSWSTLRRSNESVAAMKEQ